MRKLHIALATKDLDRSISDYSERLKSEPCVVVSGEYALWRTADLNLSVRLDLNSEPGTLRHLGWEDSEAAEFSTSTDANGIVWEHFSAQQQAAEIEELWPGIDYRP
jgi:hypothetical protein